MTSVNLPTEVVTSLTEVDQRLDEAERAAAISDDAFRERLVRFRFQPRLPRAVPDPFSSAYQDFQLDLYHELTGRRYQVANEETAFDADDVFRRPFPWSTRSAATVGGFLIAYGFFIQELGLRPGAKVLELGSGYGSLTMNLALTGYDVTCVDMSRRLLDFVERRARQLDVPVKTICGDMATVAIPGRFDAILFHESFHHCFQHQLMVSRLSDLLAPGGKVGFAAEPIVEEGNPLVPYPWGLRLDGLSLLSTRRWGWMELGFQRSYFFELLRRAGWRLDYRALRYVEWANLYLATRAAEHLPARFDARRTLVEAVDLAAASAKCIVEEGWPVFIRRAWGRLRGH
jgi:2-polyprenyl-3-methyl-5-hydroxy-6-metoxy-1,4-benzoquinol methylase